jgi:hypothetical protein
MALPVAVESELSRMNLTSARIIRRHIAEQHNEILRLRAHQEWRPVATVPKGNTHVLICTHDGVVALCRWEEHFISELVDGEWVSRGAWTDDSFADSDREDKEVYDPTYWILAPNPPTEPEASRQTKVQVGC